MIKDSSGKQRNLHEDHSRYYYWNTSKVLFLFLDIYFFFFTSFFSRFTFFSFMQVVQGQKVIFIFYTFVGKACFLFWRRNSRCRSSVSFYSSHISLIKNLTVAAVHTLPEHKNWGFQDVCIVKVIPQKLKFPMNFFETVP